MIDCWPDTEIFMMALTVWREARGENNLCKVAVAHSILNRVERPCWWGDTILSVIKKKWQYSSMTAPNDPNLVKYPGDGEDAWKECVTIADAVVKGLIVNPVPGADSYFDSSLNDYPPRWKSSARFVRTIGHINFYDVDRDYEQPVLVSGDPTAGGNP